MVSNEEIINDFVKGGLRGTSFEMTVASTAHSFLIFEMIVEDLEKKVETFQAIHRYKPTPVLYKSC